MWLPLDHRALGGHLAQLDPEEIQETRGGLKSDRRDRLEPLEVVELKESQENQEYQVMFCLRTVFIYNQMSEDKAVERYTYIHIFYINIMKKWYQ